MEKILINDILKFSDEEVSKVRIKFNIYNGYNDPMELYKENPSIVNDEWFLWQDERRYFREGQTAICFLKIGNDTWLMTTIKKIIKELDVTGAIGYEAEEMEAYKKYFGRLVVKFHNTSRTMGRTYQAVMEDLEVLEILNDQFTGEDFPGYENVRLTWKQLRNIIDRQLPGWIPALKNQKAVYLITDISTGKLYVGSATAQYGMLLQRWSSYASNGHGGNIELEKLVREKGLSYIEDNFQYSILENYNARIDDHYILKREAWWKDTLKSREFGYNGN